MIERLNTERFKQKVFDFHNNKEWKFNGNKPAIIDFYADWCGPCKQVAPIMDELSKEFTGKIDFYKVNTDEEQELSGIFGIRSIPSILFIPLAEKPQMSVGALGKQDFKNTIKNVLNIDKYDN